MDCAQKYITIICKVTYDRNRHSDKVSDQIMTILCKGKLLGWYWHKRVYIYLYRYIYIYIYIDIDIDIDIDIYIDIDI